MEKNKIKHKNIINNNNHSVKSYFALMKEFEERKDEILPKKIPYKPQKKLTEQIYNNYSSNLSHYFKENKNSIALYGSHNYNNLTIDKLVEQMKIYKPLILKRIQENTIEENVNNENNDDNNNEKLLDKENNESIYFGYPMNSTNPYININNNNSKTYFQNQIHNQNNNFNIIHTNYEQLNYQQ